MSGVATNRGGARAPPPSVAAASACTASVVSRCGGGASTSAPVTLPPTRTSRRTVAAAAAAARSGASPVGRRPHAPLPGAGPVQGQRDRSKRQSSALLRMAGRGRHARRARCGERGRPRTNSVGARCSQRTRHTVPAAARSAVASGSATKALAVRTRVGRAAIRAGRPWAGSVDARRAAVSARRRRGARAPRPPARPPLVLRSRTYARTAMACQHSGVSKSVCTRVCTLRCSGGVLRARDRGASAARRRSVNRFAVPLFLVVVFAPSGPLIFGVGTSTPPTTTPRGNQEWIFHPFSSRPPSPVSRAGRRAASAARPLPRRQPRPWPSVWLRTWRPGRPGAAAVGGCPVLSPPPPLP